MNKITDLPFNVTLFDPSDQRLGLMRPTTVVDIYDGQTTNFHEDGLYSLLTFGDSQSGLRDQRFSYINLNTEIFHPFIFRQILRIKGFYRDIISGKKHAIWNDKIKDFEPSNEVEGETGYGFFYKHYAQLKFVPTDSSERKLRIDMLEKFKARSFIKRHLVLPAGLRDIEINDAGRPVEDPVNEIYRKIIAFSRSLEGAGAHLNNPIYDRARYNLQLAAEEVFDYFFKLLTGKRGFIQKKYASRRVFDGTRNVITSLDTSSVSLNDERQVKVVDTQFGLFQTIRGTLPQTVNRLRTGFLESVISEGSREANLVNPDTLKAEVVQLTPLSQDRWGTVEGLKKSIANFSYAGLRHKPVRIEGRYIGLVYRTDKVVKFFNGIEELPEGLDKNDVHPITWGELFYHSIQRDVGNIYAVVTRYPVTGAGSTYVTRAYVKTTVTGLRLKGLGSDWGESEEEYLEWPDVDNALDWVDSMSPATSRLKLLGADFDGDTMSATFVFSEEAAAECALYLNSKEALLGPDGSIYSGMVTDMCEWVLLNLSAKVD